MLKRCAILAPLMLARCALALRGAPALIAPSMRGAARRLPRAPRPFASPLVARLSQGVEQAEKSDEEKARLKAEREERKEAKRLAAEEKKAAKAAKAAAALLEEEAANAPLAPIAFFRFDAEPAQRVGDYETTMSHGESGRDFKLAADLGRDGGVPAGESVWLRARVANVRSKGSSAFLVLRQGAFTTVQACLFKDKENPDESKRMLKWLSELPLESVIDIKGTLVEASVKSCTQSNVELQLERCYCVSRAANVLPFLLEDAARPEEEVDASQDTDRPFPRIGQEQRLDNRWLDLRVPANNAIMRVQSGVCTLFREALLERGFVEIHSPKLIPGESEGGSEVFRTDYFGSPACLAQSPQLYKQMAIAADLERVFEVGPVFRAENSNTRRHLCEFTGLDFEMGIHEHYNEVLRVAHATFTHIFSGLESRYARELAVVREQFASEPVRFSEDPCIVHWEDAIAMLREAGELGPDEGTFDDLTGALELALGRLVKDKHGVDFFILDRFPSAIRPFYTMPCPDDARYSNSYDLFLRGQEICSGAQRCHEPELLERILAEKGVDAAPLDAYISSFRHGAAPHGGVGIGLERVVFLYLGLDNVRKASMFPRDPKRCSP